MTCVELQWESLSGVDDELCLLRVWSYFSQREADNFMQGKQAYVNSYASVSIETIKEAWTLLNKCHVQCVPSVPIPDACLFFFFW